MVRNKITLSILGLLIAIFAVAMYWYQRGDAIWVQPPSDMQKEDVSANQSSLPDPVAPLSDWHMHRQSDTSIIFTREEELPNIGATEGYAYGEQITTSVIPFDGDIMHPEEWEQISWISDEAMVHVTEWTNFSDFTALRVRHEAGGASGQQLTFYLFAEDRVYNLSLYPVDEENEREFTGFVYQYADQLRDMMIENSDVEPNSFRWGCPNDYQFRITYSSEDKQDALLELPTETHRVSVARSGSGARYVNEDESVVFWEHQGEASMEVDGEMVREQCVVESKEVREL